MIGRTSLLFLLLFGVSAAVAAPPPHPADGSLYDWDMAGRIAVQTGGRMKPLETFARDLVAQIYGKSAYPGQHPVETYFRWMADGEAWAGAPLIYIPKSDLRDQLGLARPGNYFSMEEVRQSRALMDLVMEGQRRETAGDKATFTQTKASELLNRLHTLSAVFSHDLPLFVPAAGGDPDTPWQAMTEALSLLNDSAGAANPQTGALPALGLGFAAMYNAVRDDRPDIFNTAAALFLTSQRELLAPHAAALSRLQWEHIYNHLRPFLWAKALLAAGLGLLLLSLRGALSRVYGAGWAAMCGGLLFYTAGLALRTGIGGRAPWSNMYESLLAIGWVLVFIAIIYELVRRDRVLGIVGSILGFLILGVAQFASLDRGINPLVPALQSYWLNYHVIITLSGYACFAIAMGIGHAVLINGVRSGGHVTPALAGLAKANLRIIQIGSLFLITGILLGAVWANVSWGRFWGWDPKETWALICWFAYIVLLHGRSAGWLGWRGLAAWSVAIFPVVIMTYYGVNYYLSGLHSYGAGSAPGIPWQVFAYVGLEVLFLLWALSKLLGKVGRRPVKSGTAASTSTGEVAS